MPEALAGIEDLRHNRGMAESLPVSLLEDLHAAAAASGGIHFDPDDGTHFDICTVYTEGSGFGCTCGVPQLLRSLAELLPLPVAASA